GWPGPSPARSAAERRSGLEVGQEVRDGGAAEGGGPEVGADPGAEAGGERRGAGLVAGAGPDAAGGGRGGAAVAGAEVVGGGAGGAEVGLADGGDDQGRLAPRAAALEAGGGDDHPGQLVG